MGSVFIAFITAFLSYLYLKYTAPAYNESGGFSAPIIAFGFLVGLQMVTSLASRSNYRQTLQSFQLRVELRLYLLQWLRTHRLCMSISLIYIKL